MRRYRHRQSGAVFETERDMPVIEWEPIGENTEPPKKEATAQSRRRTKRQTKPKE